jgi:hypothetical protein
VLEQLAHFEFSYAGPNFVSQRHAAYSACSAGKAASGR